MPMGWLGRKDPLQIVAFQSYGTPQRLYIRGRALEDESIDLARKGFVPLLTNSWKRFETDEIRHAPLRIRLPDDRVFELTTDMEGYYLLDQQAQALDSLTNEEGWVHFEMSYREGQLSRPVLGENRFPGAMLIPSATARYGVISDIDDTILQTGVTSYLKWRVIVNTLFKRAESRIPLSGAAELYHTLHKGTDGQAANPIFYVSHSPWNLYRYLELFLRRNQFPKGPILLRSMASFWRRKREDVPHKQHEIVNILESYPKLSFVLIGDSGEKDADIYLDIARRYPGRIRAIYLRTVRHPGRMKRVRNLIAHERTVPVLLAEKSREILSHARELGLLK